LEEVKKLSSIPVIDVLTPAVEKAISATKSKKIGVIGTQGTINSKAYEKAIRLLDPSIEVISVACPLFVPLAEEGLYKHQATKSLAADYLDHIKESGVDTLILGCTHYPLLLDTIAKTVGPRITLIDSALPTVGELKKVLKEKNMLSEDPNSTHEFFVTDAPEKVFKVASRFFGQELKNKIKKVTL